eukprot:6469170-Amphidinium_carterae.1
MHEFAAYDAYVRPLPWPELRNDVGELASLLGKLPRTAAGPDGVSNEMLSSAPAWVAPVLCGALHDILQGDRPPPSWHDSLLVLLPKDNVVTAPPDRFRPLALCNSMSKVLSRYILFQLAVIFDHLEPTQQGFMPNRSIAMAIGRLEHGAHVAASQSLDACLLLCDFANAFGSMSRAWMKHCMLQSGMGVRLFSYFADLLRPSSLFFQWKNSTDTVMAMNEGGPQGGPLSPFCFLIGLDPLLRRLVDMQGPRELSSAWADDLAVVCNSISSLLRSFDAIIAFERVAGLRLQLAKCALVPLGALSLDQWDAYARTQVPAGHALLLLPVKTGAKYLGIFVGRGADHDCTVLAHPRFQERGTLVAAMGLGTPHGLQLFQVVGTSTLRHVIACALPSFQLHRLWDRVLATCFPATTPLGDSKFYAKELHGWPSSAVGLTDFWLRSSLCSLDRLEADPEQVHANLCRLSGLALSAVNPLGGWLLRGAWASWAEALKTLRHQQLAVFRLGGLKLRVNKPTAQRRIRE